MSHSFSTETVTLWAFYSVMNMLITVAYQIKAGVLRNVLDLPIKLQQQ